MKEPLPSADMELVFSYLNILPSENLPCRICGNIFPDRQEINNHLKDKHDLNIIQ